MKSHLQPELPELYGRFGFSEKVRQDFELFVKVLRHAEALEKNFVALPHVLMSRSGGIDRMQIAAALAASSARPLVAAHARELKSTVEGESSERIRKLFERAHAQAPCLLFIDELDLIATSRGGPNNDERSTEVVRELYAQISTPHSGRLLLMAYADNPENLDSSIHLKFSKTVDLWKPWQGLVLRPDIREQLDRVLQSMQSGTGGFSTLIFGPPGSGKTQIIRQLAMSSGLPLVTAGAVDFKAGYVGQSGARVREVFAKLRSDTPAILFIDLDAPLMPPRNSHFSHSFSDELINEFLAQMDFLHGKHPGVFIIGEVSETDRIDVAVVSRFDIKIEIPLPTESERREILEQMISNSAVFTAAPDVNEISAHLARSLPDASGRDLYTVVRTAIGRAQNRSAHSNLGQLTREDLLTAAQESHRYVKD